MSGVLGFVACGMTNHSQRLAVLVPDPFDVFL